MASVTKIGIDLSKPLIKQWEGFEPKAYVCPAGKWTIGWGTTKYPNRKLVREGDTATQHQAEEYLDYDIEKNFLPAIVRNLKFNLNPNQLAAVISAVYNLGPVFVTPGSSTFLALLNNNKPYHAAEQFHRWIYSNGKKVSGLKKRRRAEKRLFLTPFETEKELWYPDGTLVEKLDV